MQSFNWMVSDFGQQFTLEPKLSALKLYFRKEEQLLIKWVRWQKHPNLSEWKEYLVSGRVLHYSDSQEDAAMMCYCGKENFWPLKVKRLSLFFEAFYHRHYHCLKGFILNVRGCDGQSVYLHLGQFLLMVQAAWSLVLIGSTSFLRDFLIGVWW